MEDNLDPDLSSERCHNVAPSGQTTQVGERQVTHSWDINRKRTYCRWSEVLHIIVIT
jgi:hypothetical protein